MPTQSYNRKLRAVLLSGVAAFGSSLVAIDSALAVVPRDEQAPATTVTFPSIPGPGGAPTTTSVAAGALADANDVYSYVGYSVTDLTTYGLPGFIGQCSGALINPRFFLTAAHCYNDGGTRPDTEYGVGGIHRHAVSFRPLPLANNSLSNWLFGTAMLNGVTNNGYTDVVSVRYAPGNIDFLQGDIAVVTLASPVSNVGTTPLLMSALDGQRDSIIAGFGLTGSGSAGATISSRVRRVAQNNVGALGSFDDICVQTYGDVPGCFGLPLPQDLYWNDFDSRTLAPGVRADVDDFDFLPGATRPNEGTTAGGDSGSSLFVNINGTQISVGPLSGGLRFFGSQPFSSYGTASFWQPAFLYANWIASVNPTRYYVANAGNFAWTAGAAWNEFLDPNFLVLSGGALVNGLPATDAGTGASPNIGIFNDGSIAPADGTGGAALVAPAISVVSVLDAGLVGLPSISGDLMGDPDITPSPSIEPPAGGIGSVAPDAATSPSTPPGAPRAVGTVALTPVAAFPNNINGTNTINGRYFDVTLRNAGTVTLSGLSPTIDRLTINGAGARLVVDPGNTLTSLVSPELWSGNLTVNGNLTSALNIWQLGGRIQGTGTIAAGLGGGFMRLGGTLAPGNSIGTINVIGPYIQGPASILEIEVSNVASDVVAVTGNALLNGTVQFLPFGTPPTAGQSYTFLTTTGTVAGTFSSVQDLLPGALFPVVDYGSNFARVTVRTLCTTASGPIQTPTCTALSDPAVQADPDMIPAIAALQSLAVIQPDKLGLALEALNPTRAHAQAIVGLSAGDLLRNQFGRRTHDLFGGTADADVAQRDLAGAQLASLTPSAEMLATAATAALDAADAPAGGGSDIALSNGYAMFFAADVALTDTDQAAGLGTDEADVAALTAGLDHHDGSGIVYGAALSYLQSNVSQDYGLGGNTSSDGVALSGYGTWRRDLLYADAFASFAWHGFETERTLLVAPFTTAIASGSTDASQAQAGITLGYGLNKNATASFGAVGGLYYIGLDIDGYTETGAGALSAVLPSRTIDSLRTQLGGEVAVRLQPGNDALVPILRLVWNHEFEDDALVTSAGFAGAPATTFTTPGPDLGSDWATLGVGLSGRVSDSTSFYFRYQHDFGRDGQENQEVSAAARMAF